MIQYENDMNPALCNVKPSGIRKFFSIAEEMDNVISLGVGEPDFLTPWHIRREGPAGIICSTGLKIRCW